jgi:hypothetical protein
VADTLRIKRRAAGGAAGPPSSLAAAELAFNEQNNVLYYGKGNSGGVATSIIPIAGPGVDTIINVKSAPYNAVGNGVADDTAAIQAAIDATPYNGTLYLPAGSYKGIGSGSDIWHRSTPINIVGDGWVSCLFADASVPNTRDILRITATAAGPGWSFRDFQIGVGGAARGRHALHFDTPTALVYNVSIRKLFIFPTAGGKSIRTVGPTASGTLAYSQIEECNLESIELNGLGDNVGIENNTITSNAGTNYAIYIQQVPGAANARIVGNVIATLDCQIVIDSAVTPVIRDNEFETPIGVVNTGARLLWIRGTVSSITSPQILNNQVSVLPGTNNPIPIVIDNSDNPTIAGGRIFVVSGSHISIASGVTNVCIGNDIHFATDSVTGPPSIFGTGTNLSYPVRFNYGTAFSLAYWTSGTRIGSANIVGFLSSGSNILITGTTAATIGLVSSPDLAGIPTADTAAPGTNTRQIATTAFVQAAAGVGGSTIWNPNFLGVGGVGEGLFSVDGVLFGNHTGNYHFLYDRTGTMPAVQIGNVTDPSNYYNNTNHFFRSRALSTNYASITAAGFALFGATSGSVTLSVPAAAGSNTLTVPAATDTLVARNTTDTLTNKSLTGVIDGSAAAAGNIGEYLEVNRGSTLGPLTANTVTTITSISLTAGDWDVRAFSSYITTGAGAGTLSISPGSVAIDTGITRTTTREFPANRADTLVLPGTRVSLTATTTVYLTARTPLSTVVVQDGVIMARRVR